eukprot:g30755.t1
MNVKCTIPRAVELFLDSTLQLTLLLRLLVVTQIFFFSDVYFVFNPKISCRILRDRITKVYHSCSKKEEAQSRQYTHSR